MAETDTGTTQGPMTGPSQNPQDELADLKHQLQRLERKVDNTWYLVLFGILLFATALSKAYNGIGLILGVIGILVGLRWLIKLLKNGK